MVAPAAAAGLMFFIYWPDVNQKQPIERGEPWTMQGGIAASFEAPASKPAEQ